MTKNEIMHEIAANKIALAELQKRSGIYEEERNRLAKLHVPNMAQKLAELRSKVNHLETRQLAEPDNQELQSELDSTRKEISDLLDIMDNSKYTDVFELLKKTNSEARRVEGAIETGYKELAEIEHTELIESFRPNGAAINKLRRLLQLEAFRITYGRVYGGSLDREAIMSQAYKYLFPEGFAPLDEFQQTFVQEVDSEIAKIDTGEAA